MEDSYEGFTKPIDGELTFHSEVEEELFGRFIAKFEGENLWIEITSKKPTRTQRQNRFYWAYLEIISDYTGHTNNELHNEFKYRFLPTEIKKGVSQEYEEKVSTTKLTKTQFNDYIQQIELETGIQAPSKQRYSL